ncbi:cAMP-binding domain of CRP or a regulatory subunit of cAMP-dependent protein kinases [Aliiroseovarius sediminilitoris]|uniref:cAMP-binding domain of CRP or a regulatory subunit of cAMP-dependent protein kinases n=2 Tax=Aliiroseovarius sediminilitoris TaxID=1173584 RepID=A0A1I0QFG9_9RHOB|nr:cAMP-binding domain of CRP or a regulatory subunit of cAMP-dependent protein kinases [Aliiroseovarius sediminilitoris]
MHGVVCRGKTVPLEMYKMIARNSLFMRALPDVHVDAILSQATWRHFERGETLFMQEDSADAIHIVLDGWVKLYRMTRGGTEAVVSVFTRGESFGEAVALRKLPYPVSGEAATNCEVMHIPTNVMLQLVKQDPEVALSILSSTFTHLHGLVTQLEQLKAKTAPQRVAEFLLALCDGTSEDCTIQLPYDKVLIAGRLGMKPESLSRAFSRLGTYGVRIDKSSAIISDVQRLRDYARDDG